MSNVWQPNPAYGLELPDITNVIVESPVILAQPGLQDLGFVYSQGTPSATWTIQHTLDFYPNITVVDSGGTIVEGEIDYQSQGTVVLTFRSAFSGTAYLS
jgi:hypothetical protein